MASEEDIWIEKDGKLIYAVTKTTDGTQKVTVPEMTVIHRAFVQSRSKYIATVASGGISGNAIALEWYDPTSGQKTSGLGVSGSLLDILAIGA